VAGQLTGAGQRAWGRNENDLAHYAAILL